MDINSVYLAPGLYFFSYFYYLSVSHGLGNKATFLQLRRFLPCAIVAVLPIMMGQVPLTAPYLSTSLLTGFLWITTYPLLYFITYRKSSTDFGFHFDPVFGMYIIGWMMSLKLLVISLNLLPNVFMPVLATVEFLIFMIPFAQWVYYYLYRTCVTEDGMMMIQETHYNEIIEYFKSFSVGFNIITFALVAGLYALFIWANLEYTSVMLALWQIIFLAGLSLVLGIYLWKKRKGVFIRTGIVELYFDIKEYFETTMLYQTNMKERIKDLEVTPSVPEFKEPSTIILVIGESASRDYMSAFTDYEHETTPWLSAKKQDSHFILYPNSYSSIPHTVSSLERALTEFNQYNDKQFYTSCSIIDIAHKAGYTTHWYSNQGHLGCADTPVTLVANTSGTAKWTKQNLNEVQYDEMLLEYLDEIDPTKNNFVVVHLKGNHFNFINRYPQSFAKFSEPGKYDLINNYIDSIAYTDYILQKIWEYGKEKLNMQAMLYFSDHATIPDKRRSPDFGGFGTVRIPMFTYFSDNYIEKYPETYQALLDNKNKYFTNDWAYELVCGILNIKSNHYDETNSLASPLYKYTRDMLKTNLGQRSLSEDVD